MGKDTASAKLYSLIIQCLGFALFFLSLVLYGVFPMGIQGIKCFR
nr:MAG TPA: hypothetical protein [Caudoviricetes sp.]